MRCRLEVSGNGENGERSTFVAEVEAENVGYRRLLDLTEQALGRAKTGDQLGGAFDGARIDVARGVPSLGLAAIAEERQRQVVEKGYTPEHDASHTDGELWIAARDLLNNEEESYGCWGLVAKYADDRVRQLVIAGALVAAEVDRLIAETAKTD